MFEHLAHSAHSAHSIPPTMPNLPDTTLPILTEPLSPATAAKIMLAIIGLILIAVVVLYASPANQTCKLSAAMTSLEKVFGEIALAGFPGLSPHDVQTLVSGMQLLRIQVGGLREQRLHSSRAWGTALSEFLRGRSIALYRCIENVKDFETRLEILKEKQRNSVFSSAVSQSTGTAQLRHCSP
ncbi:hypothetical protein C8R46DRAFT_1360824 [Mycena filopes]|nr:hypothetical protein C8R46DRAFT_1360824 [Mycena filopes]